MRQRSVTPAEVINQTLDATPLTLEHWKVWFLSSMGIFLEGFNLFVIGVALPLLAHQYSVSPTLQGVIGAAAIAGTIVGSMLMGLLADRFGRKPFYITNLVLVLLFALLSGLSRSIPMLIMCQFMLGVGVGADYPICAAYISEFMPARIRGRMLMATFSFQALGMLTAAAAGMAVLSYYPHQEAWHLMLILGCIPALIILYFRTAIPESPRWLIEHGKKKKAVKILKQFLPAKRKEIEAFLIIEKEEIDRTVAEKLGYRALFSRQYIRRTILASCPWFFMDIATYGVGIFTPTILAALALTGSGSFISEDFAATKGAAFLDLFLVLGFIINLFLVERLGRIRLQLIGFFGMVIGLLLLALGATVDHSHHIPFSAFSWINPKDFSIILIFSGFILYNLLMNVGPNATTFILAAELFPTRLRASGHGFSAAVAKMGATLGIFLLPILKAAIGIQLTMLCIAVICFGGLLVTWVFQIETKNDSIDKMKSWDAAQAMEKHF